MDRFRQSTFHDEPEIEREIYTFSKINNQVGMWSAWAITTGGNEVRARFANLVTNFKDAQTHEFRDIAETFLSLARSTKWIRLLNFLQPLP